MFKTKRTKELEACERELYILKMEIQQMATWCAADSPEIGFAVQRLLHNTGSILTWREKLRRGDFNCFENYIEYLLKKEKSQ